MLSLIYFNYRLPFPSIDYYLSISSYLVSLNSQHKVTIQFYGRQSTILLCQNVGGQLGRQGPSQMQPFVLTLGSAIPHSGLIRLLGKCVLFLQSTPQQNWILLSVYHNRSELIRFLSRFPCSCDNTCTGQYNFLYLLQRHKIID